MSYAKLSLPEVTTARRAVARDAEATFGGLDARQLNWKPEAARWSVAQCFQHLFVGNRMIFRNAEEALRDSPRTFWQRVPLLPALWGRMLILTQGPKVTRKYVAPVQARPTTSEISADIIQRFIDQHRITAEWTEALREHDVAQAIMVSPFIRFVTYSVLDAFRLVVAHDRRHFEQARRVTAAPGV